MKDPSCRPTGHDTNALEAQSQLFQQRGCSLNGLGIFWLGHDVRQGPIEVQEDPDSQGWVSRWGERWW
jgi:hypothetical protein